MIIRPLSFNGTSLQSTDFEATIPPSAPISPSVSTVFVKRAGAWPVYAGGDFNTTTFNIRVQCLNDWTETFETLTKVFNVEDETPRQLIIADTEDTSAENPKQYYVYAVPRQIVAEPAGGIATVQLAFDDPIWQSVTQNSQTFATTSATDSTSVTANGNADSYPVLEFTPTSQPTTDYLYNKYLCVLPTSTDPWPNRFLDVTETTDGTGLDTAALIAAGKMQASTDPGGAGGDLRLFRDGIEVDRELSNIATTDTHVITRCDMPAALNMTLKTAIGTTDTVTEIQLVYNTDNKSKISQMANTGRLILDTTQGSTDTEEFTYTARTITATKLAFTINARAVRGTVAVDHAAGTAVRRLPYDFNLVYGNPTVLAPTIDEQRKPIQDLTSRNSLMVFTQFGDEDGLRSGIWRTIPPKVSDVNLTRSGVFTSTSDEGDTDPFTEMGLKALTFLKTGSWRSDSVSLGWFNHFPDKIASVASVAGEQTQSTSVWPTLALKISASQASTSYTNLWTISAQAATDYGTWTAWTKASSDATIPANKSYLGWFQSGTMSGTTDAYAKGGMSAISVGLTNIPHITIRAENTNYQANFVIRNETTGESITVSGFPMDLNETLYIDTDPSFPKATYKGQLVSGIVKTDTIRSAWLKLQPGANTIGYEYGGSGASDVSIAIKHRDRMRIL